MGQQLFNKPLGGTQYSTPIRLPGKAGQIGVIFDHPAATTTAYSFEVTNQDFGEIANNTALWAPLADVTVGSKSSAEVFAKIVPSLPFTWLRVKMVTTFGNGLGRSFSETVKGIGSVTATGGGGGVTAHSALTGLTTGNDHPQYALLTDLAGRVPTSRNVNTSGALSGGGPLSGDLTLAIAAASGSVPGTMSAADFTKLAGFTAPPYRATQTLGSAQATVVFSGLDGNTHKRYRLRGWGPTADGRTGSIEINNNANAVVYSTITQDNGGAPGGSAAFAFATYPATTFVFEVECIPTSGALKRAIRGQAGIITAGGRSQYLSFCEWPNTTDNITSITVRISGASGFLTGFVASIEEVP